MELGRSNNKKNNNKYYYIYTIIESLVVAEVVVNQRITWRRVALGTKHRKANHEQDKIEIICGGFVPREVM